VECFWTVNSYGYPNPFGNSRAQQVWETLLEYREFTNYTELKQYWAGPAAPRKLSSNAVESWKAAFEQFGLLHVPSGSGQVRFTPAGEQLVAAGTAGQVDDFNWIGLNLLLRYPLRGVPGRRPRDECHAGSDLLLYGFVLATMLDLGGELWWPELARVLCRVFKTADGPPAIERIRALRAGDVDVENLLSPVPDERGAFYNSLNQVIVQSGLNYQLIDRERGDPAYGEFAESQVRFWLTDDGRRAVTRALGGAPDECAGSTPLWTERLPRAYGSFADEKEYFAYLGEEVSLDPVEPMAQRPIRASIAGAATWILRAGEDVDVLDNGQVKGPVAVLCGLAVDDRVVLSSVPSTTFLVKDKQRVASEVTLSLRAAKPIIDWSPIQAILEEASDNGR
jgi:hypothetical protein